MLGNQIFSKQLKRTFGPNALFTGTDTHTYVLQTGFANGMTTRWSLTLKGKLTL